MTWSGDVKFAFGRVLTRKLLRDLFSRKASTFVLIALVAVGTGSLIVMLSLYQDLDGTRGRYYRDYRLAHFTIDLKRCPESAVQLVQNAPNVQSAQGRVAVPVLLDLSGKVEPISGIALSLPQVRRPIINDLLLISGTWFSGRDEREAILNESFAKANGLVPGSRIKVMLLDEQHDVLVVGTAASPEFVFLMPMDGGFAPDPERFGAIYMSEDFLQNSADLKGAYNQIIGHSHDSSLKALRNMLDYLEDVLDPWGVTNTTPMQEQASVRFLQDELTGLRSSAVIMPTIFLGVAMLILNVLLGRLVAQQRTTIGTLRAIGRSTTSISIHYMLYGGIIGLLGGLAGIGLTLWLQSALVGVYRQFYTFPRLDAHFYANYHIFGVLVSVTVGAGGSLRAALKAAALAPAEAMRPPPPEKGGRIIVERLTFFWKRLAFRWRLVMRAIFRNPFRSTVNLATTLLAMSLLIASFSMADAMHYLVDYQFNMISHEDLSVGLREPNGVRAPKELHDFSAIAKVEPQLGVVCDISNGPLRKRLGVLGLPQNGELFTPLDANDRPIDIPEEGLVLTDKVSRILEVGPGDTLVLRPLIGRRETVEAPVIAVVQSYLGLSAYADIDYLSGLIGEDRVANSLLAATYGDESWLHLYRELKRRPSVVGISTRMRAITQMMETMVAPMNVSLFVLVLFAGLIAFGSVLNTALVSLGEREREVGTFRVLGYSPREIAAILRGEQVILSAIGIFFGIFGGIGLSHLISLAYDTELYRFPVIIKPIRVLEAIALMIGFIAFAQFLIYRYVRDMPWLDALKVKE